MPVVFRDGGFRFFFYSNEGDPREPVDVYVMRGRDEAKFWLYPAPSVAYNWGYNDRMLASFLRTVEERRYEIEEAWPDHFG